MIKSRYDPRARFDPYKDVEDLKAHQRGVAHREMREQLRKPWFRTALARAADPWETFIRVAA